MLVHRLGGQAYGVYVLALTLGGLLSLLDLGLTPAIVMLMSRAWHSGDQKEMQRVLATAFTLFLGIGLLGACILAALVPWMVTSLLHVPRALQSAARFALWLSTAAFALNMWFAVFNAIPVALERYDLVAARMVGLSLVSTAVSVVYAILGGGLQGLVTINVGTVIAGIGLFYVVSRSLAPGILFRPGFDLGAFRQLARFSAFKFTGSVGGILSFRFDQFAIAALAGVGAVALYAIPANATSRIFGLIVDLVSPVFPRASKLKGDTGAIRTLFLRGTRSVALIAGLVLTGLFVFADLLLRYWIGGAEGAHVAATSTATMRWLLIAFWIQALAAIPAIFCEALGRPEINNGFSVAGAIMHVPLVLLLVPRMGITGAALALAINSATQTSVFILFASRRVAGVFPKELLSAALARPTVASAITVAVGLLVHGWIHSVPALALSFGGMLLFYLAVCLALSAVTREDVDTVAIVIDGLPVHFPGRDGLVALTRRYGASAH